MNRPLLGGILFCLVTVSLSFGCENAGDQAGAPTDTDVDSDSDTDSDTDADSDMDSDSDTDLDGDSDLDSDSDGDSDSDSDVDSDSDSDIDTNTDTDTGCVDDDEDEWCVEFDCDDTNENINPDQEENETNGIDDDCDGLTDEEPTIIDTDTGDIEPDCSGCPSVGSSIENMRCAVELCDDEVYLSSAYASPSNANTSGTYAAVERFGNASNDLEPLMNGSYALMASGTATGTAHSVGMGGESIDDSFSSDGYEINDVMEWTIHLKAPDNANGIRIHYVFFSEEYDEFISTVFNDKFYIFIEADSTQSGARTVINFTECRDPDEYSDFECTQDWEDLGICTLGDKLCYIAINTSLSECCWYDSCPDGTATTNIAGTGYVCAANQLLDTSARGSSTGWLYTEWPIDGGEEFDIIFHIHDTSDHIYDSEVILDKILFVTDVAPGTDVV